MLRRQPRGGSMSVGVVSYLTILRLGTAHKCLQTDYYKLPCMWPIVTSQLQHNTVLTKYLFSVANAKLRMKYFLFIIIIFLNRTRMMWIVLVTLSCLNRDDYRYFIKIGLKSEIVHLKKFLRIDKLFLVLGKYFFGQLITMLNCLLT